MTRRELTDPFGSDEENERYISINYLTNTIICFH